MKYQKIFRVVLAAVVSGVAVLLLVSCRDQTESADSSPKKKPPLVKVTPARVSEIASTIQLTGEVVASDSATVSSMKEGRIEFCPWREGDTVKSGEALVVIDREVHRTEVQAAQAALGLAQAKLDDLEAGTRPETIRNAQAHVRRSQATLNESRRSYERQEELFGQDVVSLDALDKAQEKVEIAEAELSVASETLAMLESGSTETQTTVVSAGVNEAAARLNLARAHLEECEITAPFSGTVAKVYVRVGDVASMREPLVEIFDPASLAIRFAVPEAQAVAVNADMTLKVSLDAMPGQSFSGRVLRIYPELDPVTRTRTIEVGLNDSTELVPHMFARLTLTLVKESDALVVPAEAVLVTPNGKRQIFVIEDGKAVQRPVVTGIEDGVNVQIVSGVKAGEKVAIAGNEKLKPGMTIRVAKDKSQTVEGGDKSAGKDASKAKANSDSKDSGETPDKSAGKDAEKSGDKEASSESKKGSQL